ncbi:MAG: hypothetical protein V2I63_05640 [Pseudomonadales bacterium]|nr:hypothetical protein [Pseudomonadales bacterium]
MKPSILLFLTLGALFALAGCTTTQTAEHCTARVAGTLDAATLDVEQRLASGCEYHFDSYFRDLLAIAEDNPAASNRVHFSDFLVRQVDTGTLSRRRAEELYNRYFAIKFVSLRGDYNTCSQTCPIRQRVLADMRTELQHKEQGLLRASEDATSFYRADTLLKETELVLEATCRACAAGGS